MLGFFLPTLRVCNDAVAPIAFPMFWTPHIVAALVFAAVLVRPWRLRGFDIALRIVLGLTILGWGAVVLPSPNVTESAAPWLVSIGFIGLLALLVLPARSSESMVARCAVIGAAASALWFGAISTDSGALFGAYSSFAASVGLVLGGFWWWLEQNLDADDYLRESHGQLGGHGRIV